MRIEEYILRELINNDDSNEILNKKSELEKEYWTGYKDAVDVVKSAIMRHYNETEFDWGKDVGSEVLED